MELKFSRMDRVVGIFIVLVIILMVSMYTTNPLNFSVFPSLLLVATLFRLGLNVASTRLVLGDGFAGHVIEAFGKVTVGGSLIIGVVVFVILVVIQFVIQFVIVIVIVVVSCASFLPVLSDACVCANDAFCL